MESSEERPGFALIPPEQHEGARAPTRGGAGARKDQRTADVVSHDAGAKGGLVSDVFYDPRYVKTAFSKLFKAQARRLEQAFPEVSTTSRALLANVQNDVTDYSEVFASDPDVARQHHSSPRKSRRP